MICKYISLSALPNEVRRYAYVPSQVLTNVRLSPNPPTIREKDAVTASDTCLIQMTVFI